MPARPVLHHLAGLIGLTLGLLAVMPAGAAPDDVFVPSYRDPTVRSESPDLLGRRAVRFATSDRFPPFQSVGPDNEPFGFNIDLSRAICDVLQLSCTIQALPWEDLTKALADGRADAVIAGLRPNAENRKTIDFTKRYLQLPARFVALADKDVGDLVPERLGGRAIGVLKGSAHEAFLRTFFAEADVRSYPHEPEARAALMSGDVELLFGDGAGLAVWLGTEEGACCAFRGGPYIESRFFGEGFAIGVRRGDERLRDALDHALDVISGNGTFGNIYLKHFPIGIY
jgi:polar amino acid transport system substrate-binding protein